MGSSGMLPRDEYPSEESYGPPRICRFKWGREADFTPVDSFDEFPWYCVVGLCEKGGCRDESEEEYYVEGV